jgi:divalent metal cation (Fe/Co/Zn/Cd) transporter
MSSSEDGIQLLHRFHVVVDGEISVRDGHKIAHEVGDEILLSLPQISEVLVHIGPEKELSIKRKK